MSENFGSKMSVLSRPYFHCEEAAFEHVESALWPKGPTCPHCGGMDRIGILKGQLTKANKKGDRKVRHGLKKCGDCRKQFTVRKGTIFEESHIPMHKWLQAILVKAHSTPMKAACMVMFVVSSKRLAWSSTLTTNTCAVTFIPTRLRASTASLNAA